MKKRYSEDVIKPSAKDKKQIVIVGGGIAGLLLAVKLGRLAKKKRLFDVTLVDRSFSYVWKPMLHNIAAGTTKDSNLTIAFIPFAKKHGFRFVHGAINAIDTHKKSIDVAINIKEGHLDKDVTSHIHYDAVIFAVGSRANDFHTPGVAENCMFLDTLDGAFHINHTLREATYNAYLENKPLNIVVVGGGATGVQLAGELHKLVGTVAKYDISDKQPPIKVILLEATKRILPGFPEKISKAAEKQMKLLGIDVRVNAMVESADKQGFTLKGGERIEASIKIWAAGVKGTQGADNLTQLHRQRNGQITVRENLQTNQDESIFAIGDCAFIQGKPVAPTAQAARQQALHLAHYIPAWITKGKAIPNFVYHNRGTVIALSDYNGWGVTGGNKTFGGGFTHGISARMTHKALYYQHYLELLGTRRGLAATFADCFNAYVHPDVDLK